MHTCVFEKRCHQGYHVVFQRISDYQRVAQLIPQQFDVQAFLLWNIDAKFSEGRQHFNIMHYASRAVSD